MKDLTEDEVRHLVWNSDERYALINKETKSFFLTSSGDDSKQWLEDQLKKMTEKHPLYFKLQLIKNPFNI
jgi:hypothetical protein